MVSLGNVLLAVEEASVGVGRIAETQALLVRADGLICNADHIMTDSVLDLLVLNAGVELG